jgi:hypothetical protein
VVDGETNRVVVTQMDDCPVGNNLQVANVVLNGTVVPANSPPTFTAPTPAEGAVLTAIAGGPSGPLFAFAAVASDPDPGTTVTMTMSPLPPGSGMVVNTFPLNPRTLNFNWRPTIAQVGSYPVTVTASDGIATVNRSFTIQVVPPPNGPPYISVNVTASNTVYYVDWTAADPGAGTASGVINLPGGQSVNVTFQAIGSSFMGAQLSCGVDYWSPSAPYISVEVPTAPPNCELLQLTGIPGTTYMVTLSQPIVDPIMAIVSLGSVANPTAYDFNAPFTIVSQGTGHFGGGAASLTQQPGDVLRGAEGHGTIKFLGTFSTFSWTMPNPEVWHGFTFAIRTTAALGNTNVQEGETATNSGTWGDPDVGDVVTLSASIGTIVKNADGTWNWSFPTDDGPAQTQMVTVTVTDSQGATDSETFQLTVNNVSPTATLNAPASVTAGSSVAVSLTAVSDPSTVDTGAGFQYAFDCGTGYGPFGPANSTNCTAPGVAGAMSVKGKVKDKDNGATEYTRSVTVPQPPAFLNDVDPPQAPTSCICLPPFMLQDPGTTHYWWIKADNGPGPLLITPYGIGVANGEAGTLTFKVYTPSNALFGTTTITQPTTMGSEVAGVTQSPGANPGDLFRVEVTVAGVPGSPVARHYRLEAVNATVIGANSPLQAQAEHYNARWGISVTSGET